MRIIGPPRAAMRQARGCGSAASAVRCGWPRRAARCAPQPARSPAGSRQRSRQPPCAARARTPCRRAAPASGANARTSSTAPAAPRQWRPPRQWPSGPRPAKPPPAPGSAPSSVDPCSPPLRASIGRTKVGSYAITMEDGFAERLHCRCVSSLKVGSLTVATCLATDAAHVGALYTSKRRDTQVFDW